MNLLGRHKKQQAPPDSPFAHGDDCRIAAIDPEVELEWSYMGEGRWERVCVCGKEDFYEPVAKRVRLDPFDPQTSHHLPQCEFADATDPAVLKVLLKVRDGADGADYVWIECGSCQSGWQVPYYRSG